LPTSGVINLPLSSPSSARTVAVVDRTADLLKAAEALVTARFTFSGNSPYAPDVVFVNEFVKEPFLVAAMNAAVNLMTNSSSNDFDKHKRSHGNTQQLDSLVQAEAENNGVNVISSLGRGKILEVKKRYIQGTPNLPNNVLIFLLSLENPHYLMPRFLAAIS
jgi:acyl-CoA reductase-like NAD-dependent aldehyde dehydrogenase